jgi:homocysteine S-methyltransferase
MNAIEAWLAHSPVLTVDGALATELERRGFDLHDPLWSAKVLVEQPDAIRAVHAEYLAAGAGCITTATYQATFEGFARRGITQAQGEVLMRLAVTLATEARDEFYDMHGSDGVPHRPLVAASIGPYGAFLADGSEYRGDYGLCEDDLAAFHMPRVRCLAATEADILACETIPCLIEARALTRVLQEFPGQCAWMSFSASDGEHISHGEPIAECAALLDGIDQVVAVGVNCTAPRYVPSLIKAIRSSTSKPIIVYPNSGETYHATTGTWGPSGEPCLLAHEARQWLALGARIVGGCCRTTPDDIRSLAVALRA